MREGETPGQLIPTRRCVVYDRKNGEVVHVHDFVPAEPGGTCDPAELREAALASAPPCEESDLAVADVPPRLFGDPMLYRVDPETEEVTGCPPRSGTRPAGG